MPRKRVSEKIQDAVLFASKRRCCLCFGLNGDTTIKSGQLAHLDKNNQNNAQANLAFLCLIHHDQYDSTTRQSKNITIGEIKNYQRLLSEKLTEQFDNLNFFEDVKVALVDTIPGLYIRTGTPHSAEIQITRLLNGSYHVLADAVWVNLFHYGAHLGQLEFSADLTNNILEYTYYPEFDEDIPSYKVVLEFTENGLKITEENAEFSPSFGMNVNLTGEYEKNS